MPTLTHKACDDARSLNGLPEDTPDEAIIGIFEQPWAAAQLGPDFLGFMNLYRVCAENAPRSMHIVDIGASTAIQSWFFRDFASYTAVDPSTSARTGGLDFTIMPENAQGLVMDGDSYLDAHPARDDQLVIMSAVPAPSLTDRVIETSPHAIVWYPGSGLRFTDAMTERIAKRYLALSNAHD